MASGVKVHQDCVDAYDDIKLKKTHRYIILQIDEQEGLIKVACKKEKDASKGQEAEFEDFRSQLPMDSGRYCIIDLTCPQKNGAMKDKLFVITWCPDQASTKSNILYTTSKKALMEKIREGMVDIQANDLDDLEYANLLEKK